MLQIALDRRAAGSDVPAMTRAPRPRPPRKELYAEGGIEPALEELLTDPLTQAVMRRDGVSAASLRNLISAMRKELRERAASC
ncbi:MAG: hypothetical protein IPK66_16300 [Rhodospirillales bacterium]|nr:hypothetical protein [Rhodospirillales bacterium]